MYIQRELSRAHRKGSQFSVIKVIGYILQLNNYQREVVKQFAVRLQGRGRCTVRAGGWV